jgi:hypothetical protein
MAAQFQGLSAEEAKDFAARWLPAWSGNDPEGLAAFYADNAFYSDPAIPDGFSGKQELLRYFTVLLARFPDWGWTNVDALPLENCFLNFWRAGIPVAGREVVCEGVCTVELRDDLIARNCVYFDRSELLAAIAEAEVRAE